MLKSILAFKNRKVPRSHYLDELASLINEVVFSEDEILILEKATDCYREGRYPNPNFTLPSKQEAKEILDFTETLFSRVCKLLNVDENEIRTCSG